MPKPDVDEPNERNAAIERRAAELESWGVTHDTARILALQEFGDERYKDVIEVDEHGNEIRRDG